MDIQLSKDLFLRLQKGDLDEKFLSNADTSLSELASSLKHGPAICCLISGYRGAGKTSLIRCLKNIIQKESDKTVFVHVDFSRYRDKANLFRWLIRELYLALQDLPTYKTLIELANKPTEEIGFI